MKNILNKVQKYKNTEVVNRIRSESGLSVKESEILFEDTKMFLFLSTVTKQNLSPTIKIDQGWHVFLLFTKDYAQFCFDCLGKFVHHAPFRNGHIIDPDITHNMLSLSKQYFGKSALSHNWSYSNMSKADCSPEPNCEAPPADCALNIKHSEFAWPE